MPVYIYVLKCPDSGAIRYVGKSTNITGRIRQHISEAVTKRYQKDHKNAWIRKVLAGGKRPILEVDRVVGDGADWKSEEIERIAYYRSIGADLTNITSGGDTPPELTEEGRRLLSEKASAQFGTPEGRQRQAELMKRLCSDPEWLAKRTLSMKRSRTSEDFRIQQSARSADQWRNSTIRAKMVAARREICATPAYREKLKVSHRNGKQIPYEQRAAATAASWKRPDVRAKHEAAMRLLYSTKIYDDRQMDLPIY